jgi:thymidylate synthase (FAD)
MRPSVRLLTTTQPVEGIDFLTDELDIIEYSGRWDYGLKSISKMGDRDIIGRWIKAGHESMLEMVDATFFIECSRVVSHELVRHRIASYQQESQRFVQYGEEEPEDLFVVPEVYEDQPQYTLFMNLYEDSLKTYKQLQQMDVSKQDARYVLPNATRTRIIVKMNLREWMHVLRLRAHPSAQPEMQEVANAILEILEERYPEVFSFVRADLDAGDRAVR